MINKMNNFLLINQSTDIINEIIKTTFFQILVDKIFSQNI